MNKPLLLLPLLALLALGGCVSAPVGPTMMVLPGPNKSFQQFQGEDQFCRGQAQSVVDPAGKAAVNNATNSAVAGTLIGATAGALIGAASGQPGSGAAIGAGAGLLVGSAAGSDVAYGSSYELQRSYDVSYQQCMYAYGNQLPQQYSSSAAGYGVRGYPRYPPPNTPPPQGVYYAHP